MQRPHTHQEHAREIRRRYAYQDFTAQPEHFRLVRWLYTRVWLNAERPSVLFDLATARLVERKVLLPGASGLARLVARIRERAAAQLWQLLADPLTAEQGDRLEALLAVPEGARQSPLDRLRRAPTRVSGPALVDALARLEEIRALRVGDLPLGRVPPNELEEPPSLKRLRPQVEALLPRVDLPGMLLEIHAHTGFADEFTHISEGKARVKELPVSTCAVLMAEACNLGLEPVSRPDIPALTRGRLSWLQQNYMRAETLIQANARLVEAQAQIPLAQAWGGGDVASADGLRFVVAVRTLNAGPNPKYFHVGRGVTYYNFTSDQFSGFHGIVIPGTLRDSLYILEGLLEQQTRLNPREIMADTAGVSDMIFGLFWLLGYQFSPRLADIGDARFWRSIVAGF